MTSPGGRQLIGEFVEGASKDWIAPARSSAALSVCDTLAVAFAARRAPVVEKVGRFLDGRRSKRLPATLWTGDRNASCEDAALLNGVAAHALDYDDVAPAWRGHPSAVILPALAALSSDVPPGSADLLDAYVVGFEVGAALGRSIIDTHYAIGWHSTSTIGVIAATAACCRLLKLDAATTSHAIGLAVAQAAGTRANFGAEAKALQAGFAAAGAVRSALLSTSGIRSGDHVMDGPTGFERLYGGQEGRARDELARLGAAPASLIGGIEIKVFPTCYATHRALAAAAGLRTLPDFAPTGITSISIVGSPGSHTPLRDSAPRSADEARFHLETCVAMMLSSGTVGLADFEREKFRTPDVVRLAELTTVEERAFDRPGRISRLTVSFGKEALTKEVDALPEIGWDDANWRRKLEDCLTGLTQRDRQRCCALAERYVGTDYRDSVRSVFAPENQRRPERAGEAPRIGGSK